MKYEYRIRAVHQPEKKTLYWPEYKTEDGWSTVSMGRFAPMSVVEFDIAKSMIKDHYLRSMETEEIIPINPEEL